jgi:hypothetical protein
MSVKSAETAVAKESPATISITKLQQPKQAPIARQWLSKRHVTAATLTYTNIEELLEAVFSMRSMTKLFNKDQLPNYMLLNQILTT